MCVKGEACSKAKFKNISFFTEVSFKVIENNLKKKVIAFALFSLFYVQIFTNMI